MMKYLNPASCDDKRLACIAAITYDEIDRISKPMNNTIRSFAEAITPPPAADNNIKAELADLAAHYEREQQTKQGGLH